MGRAANPGRPTPEANPDRLLRTSYLSPEVAFHTGEETN